MQAEDEYPPLPVKIAGQIAELSSNQHYVLLYPSKNTLTGQFKTLFLGNPHLNPYLLVFEDEDTLTNFDLAQQYINENGFKLMSNYIHFEEIRTNLLFRGFNLSELKRILQADTIDGICLQFYIVESDIQLQCSVIDMIAFDKKLPKKDKSLCFYIPQNNHYFYVQQDGTDTYAIFQKKITNQIKKELNVTVSNNRIALSTLMNEKEITIDAKSFKKLTKKDYIYLKFLDVVKLPKADYSKENSFIIFKDLSDQSQFKFTYAQVRMLKIETIFEKYMNFKARGLKASEYGLRIHDIILKPCEALSDHAPLEQLFLTESKYVKVVLALVIKESQLFYMHLEKMEELSGNNKPQFEKIITKSAANESHRKNCIDLIRRRAQSVQDSRFKNKQERIEPILYYTSDLLVRDNNNSMRLYSTLNDFLRKMQFGSISRSDYTKWQFLFTHSLLNNLKLIKEFKGELYRGVTHTETYSVGKILKFKQFSSCSNTKNVAIQFASTALYIFKNCRVSREISQFSYFQHEYQVLNLPYTEYKITSVKKETLSGKCLSVVTLEEVSVPALEIDLKDQPQLFVLWVDGEMGEGFQFSKNITQADQTTFFIHLSTTKQLEAWLKSNKKRLDDSTISVVLITNMFRKQDGVDNDIAGVHAINAFKRSYPPGKVMVYIGDLNKAKQKLTANNIEIGGSICIGNSEFSLLKFFSEVCNIG